MDSEDATIRPERVGRERHFHLPRALRCSISLAASLRHTVAWLGRKGPEEFSRRETKDLQLLRKMLDQRLYMNAITKSHDELLANPDKYRGAGGGYSIDLNKKDL